MSFEWGASEWRAGWEDEGGMERKSVHAEPCVRSPRTGGSMVHLRNSEKAPVTGGQRHLAGEGEPGNSQSNRSL